MTGAALAQMALEELGVLQEGESMTAEQAAIVIPRFTLLLDTFSSWQDMIWYEETQLFPLVAGQLEYTIGPDSADLPLSARPVKIIGAQIRLSNDPSVDFSILEESPSDYNTIALKSLQAYPREYSYNPTIPNARIKFWPVPSSNLYGVLLTLRMPLAEITTSNMNNILNLPPGFMECIMYNLAVRIAPAFGAEAAGTTRGAASTLLTKIKQQNFSTLKRRVPVDQSAPGVARGDTVPYAWQYPNGA